METIIGLSFVVIGIIWYLTFKQKQREHRIQLLNERTQIIENLKSELCSYALRLNKIGKNFCVDIEENGDYYYELEYEDKKRINDLVYKYEKNIFNDKYSNPIITYREKFSSLFPETVHIPNTIDHITQFLKREIEHFPDAKNKFYSYKRK